MRIAPGTVIGSYEVREFIGAGGMGEVYRAHDARLGRDVALKLLPTGLVSNPDRLHRFEQEARATAALSHPNITAIHDIGTYFGQPFVVSELLEGETLRGALASGALPVRTAIAYAQQIARGLSAAHRKGIVHRDLKPENLFVTQQGLVKILDFGLAKLTAAERVLEMDNQSTAAGVILGTVGYMSPEQARGDKIDHRSDIFVFGIVLYEMLSGRKAFEGSSAADTLSAILKEHPPELGQIVRDLPPAIERIVARCLEKDREDRFQSASDLGFALDAVSGFSAPLVSVAPRPRRRWSYVGAATVGVVAVAAAAMLAAPWLVRKEAPRFHQLTFRRGTVQAARFAPDARTVVYAAAWEGNPSELFSTRPEAPEARSLQLTSTGLFGLSSKGDMALALEPSGFGLVEGTLGRAALAGGLPRHLAKGVVAADWSPDGAELAAVQSVKGHSVLQYPLGKTLYDPAPGNITHIRFSPSGDAIAFLLHPVSGDTAGSVMLTDLQGRVKSLSTGWNSVLGLGWSPNGREVWFTGTRAGAAQALYAVTRTGGAERLLLRAPATLTLHDVSSEGRVLLTRDAWGAGVMALPPAAERERDLSWLDGSTAWDLSADGTAIVLEESWEAGGAARAIYLRPTTGAPAVRLGEGIPLALSPDKQWVISTTVAGDRLTLLPTGVGQQKTLPRGAITNYFPSAKWLPNGREILFSATEPGKRSRIYLQSTDGGDPRPITAEGAYGRIAVMPDGKRFVTRGTDRRLAIFSIDGGDAPPIAGAEPQDLPIIAGANGSVLYVHAASDVPAEVASIDLHTGNRSVIRTLVPPDPSGITSILRIVMTPDARSYAYTYVRALSALYLVDGIR